MNKHLIFRVDEIFSQLTASKRIFFSENTISETTAEKIYEELEQITYNIESEINTEKLNFQWIFNTKTPLQNKVGDISIIVRWKDKQGKSKCGYGALEAKKAQTNNNDKGKTLNAKERAKAVSYLENSKLIIKYLIYSKETFEIKKLDKNQVNIKAKCITIENLKKLDFSLGIRNFQKNSNTVGEQIVKRYMNGKDLYIPVDPPPENSNDEFDEIMNVLTELSEQTMGSVIFINYDGKNAFSNSYIREYGYEEIVKIATEDSLMIGEEYFMSR